jgi:hypothetical protein
MLDKKSFHPATPSPPSFVAYLVAVKEKGTATKMSSFLHVCRSMCLMWQGCVQMRSGLTLRQMC